ncbi:hypothetical protein [Paraburkholderia xenovorans]|uniref:hypothetical protein n=1 Tax=Paraburkholderia xenovorans TaxID=36873 RepID=UPI0038BDCE67
MLTKFIEVTIVSDSADTSGHARKASVRADQITSFVDISAEKFSGHPLVRISLAEPHDFLNSDDEAGGVVRAQRTIFVQEAMRLFSASCSMSLRAHSREKHHESARDDKTS